VLDEALALLADSYDPDRDYGVVLASRDWHPGVIGIVASRLVERIHRPVVLVALDGDTGRGSARSIAGFHLARALESCEEHLVRYGGHARAAGLDVRASRLDDFRAAFAEEARRHLADTPLRPELKIDLEVELEETDEEVHRLVEYFGPFGIGNPRPVFLARGVRPAGPARVVGSGHLKLQISQGKRRLEAIGFGLADRIRPDRVAEAALDVVFQLRENHYRGRTTLQARLLDIRPSE
ncbi:MAG: DHHA1 domain-containing protein, partial [Longimicrobiales bacterium]